MRHRSLLIAGLFSILLPTLGHSQSSLQSGFQNPPNSAKPHTWWHWINGNITKAGITADLEAMKAIGLGGAQIFNVEVGIPEGNTPFMSEQWKDCLAHAFKEAKRLGLEICVHNCAGWSSSGGPWVPPKYAMQNLTWSETEFHGPGKYEGTLPQPQSKLNYYQDVAVYAVRKPASNSYRNPNIRQKAGFDRGDKMAPATEKVPTGAVISDVIQVPSANGKVSYQLPSGDWVLIRMGHTPTGAVNSPSPTAGRGPEVDKLSREAMDHFWTGMMATALKANGKVGMAGLNNALIDSYEVGSQNWTPKFREEFQKRRGYDPMKYLPAVTGRILMSPETTEKFLWDMRRTICDLFADNYFGRFKELCHENGLQFSTEGYGNGSFDNLQVSGMADIPMGEFWVGGWYTESAKMAASAAHTNGRQVVGAESFTADDVHGRWLVDPYSIKALGDKIFSLGVNRYIFHRYAHQPWPGLEPGMTMGPWGMNLERTITWWDQGKSWMNYIARSQYILQSGKFVADVAAFVGEEGPNDLGNLQGTVVPDGYDHDGVDATVLNQMQVRDGKIILPSGMSYRVLLLPDSPWMTRKTLLKIQALAKQGATIIGQKPTGSPTLADASITDLADSIWKLPNVHPKGSLKSVLASQKVSPDLASTAPVSWIHRRVDGADIYFVGNPKYRANTIDVTFRIGDREPELWNAETGEIQPAKVWNQANGKTQIPLSFGPAESVFVVFRKPSAGGHFTNLKWTGAGSDVPKPPKVEIISARYEAVDGAGGVDVADKVRTLLKQGETEIGATNSNFGDPTYMHAKRLHLVYSVNGKQFTRDIAENETIELISGGSDQVPSDFSVENGKLLAWKPGEYLFTNARGKSGRFISRPTVSPIEQSWRLSFPPGKGAPASVAMSTLSSWTDSTNEGVKYFSGTATYRTSINMPKIDNSGNPYYLDLGRVKNIAEVELNGHALGTLWKAPFRVDISKYLKKGSNSLVVKVTNLWPNRLIGDEKYPAQAEYNGAIQRWPDWIKQGKPRPASQRTTFTTWRFFNEKSPLLESGLLGPVKIIQVPVISVK